MPVSEVILAHVRETLSGLPPKEAAVASRSLADHYGVSAQTINRYATSLGLRRRTKRADSGSSCVPRDAALQAGALLLISKRSSRSIPLPACDAQEILEDSGLQTGEVSPSWFRTRMRQERVSGRDILRPTPHQRLLSDHPNHVWQFDVTNCLQYFLDEKKGLGERDEDMTLYKNKIVKTAKSIRRELLRYVVVDHCTGAFYFRYFYASGERAIDGSQFLFEAMRPKDELIKRLWNGSSRERYATFPGSTESTGAPRLGKYRFHGVPFILVADRGSIISARANQNLFESLRIDLEPHLPGNPRAKGAVEGLMHHLNRFEGRLKLDRPADLEDLNRRALDWCIYINAKKLMRGVAPRSVFWSRITAQQLRLCPEEELFRLLIREPSIMRTVGGDRLIQLDGRRYQVPDPNAARQRVTVVRHPFEYPAVEVHFNGFVWLLQPIADDDYGRPQIGTRYGEFKAIMNTDTQQAKTEMEAIALGWGLKFKGAGEKRLAEAAPVGSPAPLKVFGHQMEKIGNIEFMDKRGTELDVLPAEAPINRPVSMDAVTISRSITKRLIPIVEFLQKLREEIGPLNPSLNLMLRERYGAGIEAKEAEEVMERIREGIWPEDERIAAQGAM